MGTVTKALNLLQYFDRSTPRLGLSELTRLSGQNKATVYRMMTELAQAGFVEQVGAAREYRIGPAVLRLSRLREAQVPLREVALPILRGLSDQTGETTHVSILQGNQLLALDYCYSSRHGTRATMEDAEILPLHSTSSGLVVLAFGDPGLRDAVLSGALPRYTDATPPDAQALRRILEEVRHEGLAESRGIFEADVHSFAVPIFDDRAVCHGALALAMPVSRVTPDRAAQMRAALRAAAPGLTRALGGMLP